MHERNEIDGAVAWQNLLSAPSSRWSDNRSPGDPRTAHSRIAHGVLLPELRPKFTLTRDDTFFCIGSCFARNIEEQLIYRRYMVLSRAVPFGEINGRPNGVLNKFTPASILNELRWSLAGTPFPERSLVEEDGAWRDLHLAARAGALPLDAARDRRAAVRRYFERVKEATVVIITLGLVETWYDAEENVMLNAAPSRAMTRRFPGRFRLVVTDYPAVMATLREIYGLVLAHGAPGVRIVVSVSPVPMSETFTGCDVVTANAYSKSTLRAAAGDSTRDEPNVDYYPSYEAITVSKRALTYNASDEAHVLDSAVALVTEHFLDGYGLDAAAEHPEFVELDYLYANPDVHRAVLNQEFTSGYDHWLRHGRAEGRPLRAQDRPLGLQLLVGP
jgi:hypothetical protein